MINLPDAITDPYKLSCWLRERVQYVDAQQRNLRREEGFCWLTPEQTLSLGAGFCYDQAALALRTMQTLGYNDAQLLFVWWGAWGRESGSGHFVCCWHQPDGCYALDNGRLQGPFADQQALVAQIAAGREVQGWRLFDYKQIPFGIRYQEMDQFCAT